MTEATRMDRARDTAIEEADADSAAAAVIHLLAEQGQTLATVESLTGGLVAAVVVDVAGASRVFQGGLVVYATEMKAALAGVPADLLDERGPVDPDVAEALAVGGRERCAADWCVATTGVAGPQPQGGQPVGLVYVAVAGPAGSTVRRLSLDGNRLAIRTGTVTAALRLLAEQLRADRRDGSSGDDSSGSGDRPHGSGAGPNGQGSTGA